MEFIVWRASQHTSKFISTNPPCQHAYIKMLYGFDVPTRVKKGDVYSALVVVPIVVTERWVVNIPDMYLLQDFIDAHGGAIVIAKDTPYLYVSEDQKDKQPLYTLTIYDDYLE